jgi:enamine deaminase RidA (YjgF/YER057c/UK114 family)
MVDGATIDGGIVPQTRQAIEKLMAILKEAGYGVADVVRVGVWLDDPHDFGAFNAVSAEYFGAHPPARACVQSSMMIDCKIEIDCVTYKK